VIHAHQPGSEPIDIPETIPNPVVLPKPMPNPKEPAPKEPVSIPEKRFPKGSMENPAAVCGIGMALAELALQPRYLKRGLMTLGRKRDMAEGYTCVLPGAQLSRCARGCYGCIGEVLAKEPPAEAAFR
jgi:hypothetical protein